jgi:hypothetical protein
MTIAVGWVRKVKNCEELVFISDSRLCGGHRWDECPKIMTMPCESCVLCFAGDTGYAYPMMMQVNYAMSEYNKIRTRAMDVSDLNGYVLKHINHLSQSVYDMASPDGQSENEFIFGGYSWTEKKFKLWRYCYDKTNKKFKKDGTSRWILPHVPGSIIIIGDQRETYKKVLRSILQEKYGPQGVNNGGNGLDMEPFEALRNMLREAKHIDTIGGAPQMVKSYQYMNSRPVGVYWPNKLENPFKNRTILGRSMFEFEDSEFWFMDPETFITSPCYKQPSGSMAE